MDKTSIGGRFKSYENAYRISLPKRIPTIIRVDGKAFHSYTRGLTRPFSEALWGLMGETAKHLCENIQGAILAYWQSDEISIVVQDYKELNTESWFDKNIQKMVSVSAGLASSYFSLNSGVLFNFKPKQAVFDSRVFIIPDHDEVLNYLIWRQQDATRNSIQAVGQYHFSQKELHKKNTSEIQDMLMLEKGVNWNETKTLFKRGGVVKKVTSQLNRTNWGLNTEIPIFTRDRGYLNNIIEESLAKNENDR